MDLDDDKLKATRRINGSDKDVGSMEKLIEELTKVRPHELSKDGLKLFEYINEIIDRNKELEEKNKKLNQLKEKHNVRINDLCALVDNFAYNSIPVSLVEEKIEELDNQIKEVTNNIENSVDEEKAYWKKEKHDLNMQRYVLQELLEKRK